MPGSKERTKVVADPPRRPSEATSVIGKSADRPVASATGRGCGLCEYCFTYTSGRCQGGCISVANICPDCSEQGRRCPFCRDAGFGNEARREAEDSDEDSAPDPGRAADWWTSKPKEEDEEEEDHEEEDGLLSGDGKRRKKKKKKRKGEAADDAADSRGGRRRGCCCKCILVLLALAAGAALGLYKFAPDVWDEVRSEVLKRSPVVVQQMLDGQPSSEDDAPKVHGTLPWERNGYDSHTQFGQDADEDEGEHPRPGANETKEEPEDIEGAHGGRVHANYHTSASGRAGIGPEADANLTTLTQAAAKPTQADVQRLRAKLEGATAGLQGAEGVEKEPAKEQASEGQAPVAATRGAEQDSFLASSWSGPGR